MEIVIGTKIWSSWSMRPWLVLKRSGAPFTETVVRLRRHGTTEAEILAAGSPTGLVPVLKDGSLVIWDSLAICEHLAEVFPEAGLWPEDRTARSLGRSAAAEMHAGFHSLRGECPMDLSMAPKSATLSEATHADIRRLVGLWGQLRARFGEGGPFLLGSWSIADAFFTPVATRFRSYGVPLSDFGDRGEAARYAEALLQTPEYLAWEANALSEGASAP
jgi:glutathione S-transferase